MGQPEELGARKKPKKKLKRWHKWIIGIVASIIIIGLALVGTIYFYLKSINLDDIALRHSDDVSETAEGTPDTPIEIPKIIEKPVEKASELVGGKDINSQDAIDVAAILLNSGLSLKQIAYLQGNATYDLSTEEKQKIRDLLLSKLSAEEIEMLRKITSKYGKNLNILNPDYPIEFVGETDPEKIKKNAEEWKKLQQNGGNQSSTEAPTPDGKDTEGSVSTPSPTPETALNAEQKQAKQKIDEKVEAELKSLYSICKANSSSILQKIVAEVKSDDDISATDLQSQFLDKIIAAEATCDTKFEKIKSQADSDYTKAGLQTSQQPDWSSTYEGTKKQVRADAITSISKAIK